MLCTGQLITWIYKLDVTLNVTFFSRLNNERVSSSNEKSKEINDADRKKIPPTHNKLSTSLNCLTYILSNDEILLHCSEIFEKCFIMYAYARFFFHGLFASVFIPM